MAPVVQIPTNNKVPQERPKKPGTERRPELFCRVKYCNTLPDIPFDPKFVSYPFDTHRFVQYKQTSLEKNYRHDLLTEADLGVDIDLINPETYEIAEHQNLRELAEEDERLLEDEIQAPQNTKRSRCHNRAITWLKKTEYISTEFNRYGASSDKTETKVGFGVKKRMRDEDLYLDRESQILAINKTFESAKKTISAHPGKPGVKPVSEVPVFPDFDLWKYPFAQVMFDADPAPAEKEKEMAQAMIRGVMDPESGEQFVAYFLPTEDTMNKRKIDEIDKRDYIEDEEYEYGISREYNWIVKNKTSKDYQENYFFVLRPDGVCYNELETRVKLSKRRGKSTTNSNSILVVKHRPQNEQEFKVQDLRMAQLEPPQEDEEPANDSQTNVNNDDEEVEKDDTVGTKKDSEAGSDKSEDDSDSELESKPTARPKVSDSDSEKSSSSSSVSSSSDSEDEKNSSSSSSEESDDDRKRRRRQEAQDIFGSDSD